MDALELNIVLYQIKIRKVPDYNQCRFVFHPWLEIFHSGQPSTSLLVLSDHGGTE